MAGFPQVGAELRLDLGAQFRRERGADGFERHIQLGVVPLLGVGHLPRQDRFELVYLFYALQAKAWLRVKTLTDGGAPSLTPSVPGANWYEREAFDLFGIQFEGHPNLSRIMLPDDWQGYPLRRTEPLGSEPVDFTVTRRVYGGD